MNICCVKYFYYLLVVKYSCYKLKLISKLLLIVYILYCCNNLNIIFIGKFLLFVIVF